MVLSPRSLATSAGSAVPRPPAAAFSGDLAPTATSAVVSLTRWSEPVAESGVTRVPGRAGAVPLSSSPLSLYPHGSAPGLEQEDVSLCTASACLPRSRSRPVKADFWFSVLNSVPNTKDRRLV